MKAITAARGYEKIVASMNACKLLKHIPTNNRVPGEVYVLRYFQIYDK